MLGFDTLTLCPFDQRLIDASALSSEEIDWPDTYHMRVREELSALLDGEALNWLIHQTSPLFRISRVSTLPLEPGMILSNEPGYYREGDFGIRLENLGDYGAMDRSARPPARSSED